MKKSELYSKIKKEIEKVLNYDEAAKNAVLNIIDKYLKPKKGGLTIDLETIVKRDKNGNITHIKDILSGIFLPATIENFYEAKDGSGIEVKEGLRLKRLSRHSERIRKKHKQNIKKEVDKIMEEVLEGKITSEEAKLKIEKIRSQKIDYSEILNVEGAIVGS